MSTSTPSKLPSLLSAFPKAAAIIDEQRPLIARAIADHVTVDWDDTSLTIHCDDESTFQLLTTEHQSRFLTDLFKAECAFQTVHILPPQSTEPDLFKPAAETTKRNTLSIVERAKLLTWLDENRALCPVNSDAELAPIAAEKLGFTVSPSNIRTIREALKIPRCAPPPPDTDLAALAAKVAEHDIQLGPLKANSLPAMLTALRDTIHRLELRIVSLEASSD